MAKVFPSYRSGKSETKSVEIVDVDIEQYKSHCGLWIDGSAPETYLRDKFLTYVCNALNEKKSAIVIGDKVQKLFPPVLSGGKMLVVLGDHSSKSTVFDEHTKITEVNPNRPTSTEQTDSNDEILQLRQQIELQKSQLAEARRVAARETQRYDQLAREMEEDRKRFDVMLDRLNERAMINDMLRDVLVARSTGRLRMTETHRGVVAHVHDDEVTVIYKVDDDIVEHIYFRSQFQDGRLPKEGDQLQLTVHVSEVDTQLSDSSSHLVSNVPRTRKNLRPVPDDF